MMRTVYILLGVLLSLSFNNFVCAQPPSPGTHLYFPTLDKFEGTWKWASGTSEVIIRLKKVHYYFKPSADYTKDIIMGVYSYIENGVLIENYLSDFTAVGQNCRGTIFLSGRIDGSNPDFIDGTLRDPLKHKSNYLGLTFSNSGVPELQWKVGNRDYAFETPAGPPFDYTFTLPAKMVLIKQ